MNFVIGQRWASASEPHLGLGMVTDVAGRRVTLSFPAADEERTYATDTAPLSRIQYAVGDTIKDHDDHEYQILEVLELRNILLYVCNDSQGKEVQLPELEISSFIHMTAPLQRFTASHLDKPALYQLRIDTLNHQARCRQSSSKGLMGSRTSLLSHQVYIAHEVARRHAPRVLLADEVGLGKTIEAGMILHARILNGLAERVLILVPDSLVHQWLVEMLRRFQLKFSVFDLERALDTSGVENPFENEQRIICPAGLFEDDPELQKQVLEAQWDMVIIDEAHHLEWHPDSASPMYQFAEQLARQVESLLLLTATPEQAGIDGHFARLKLLDPDRYTSLDQFIEEQSHYSSLNKVVQGLVSQPEVDANTCATLKPWLGDDTPEAGSPANEVIDKLLDRHGTGRVLFRNTRAAIGGFPSRHANMAPLQWPDCYEGIQGQLALTPEILMSTDSWLEQDPRVAWLVSLLKSLKKQKVLVICHHAETALALDKYLNLRAGIRSASFFEGLSLIERDRAAAYFADQESGAQALICSEIGSEGRNFQFSSHLVLFDLPENPDLLEQRIGRLDRIGQSHDIEIHAPYFEHSAQEVLLKWMDQGIGIFEHSCSAGHQIYEQFSDRLHQLIESPDDSALELLIADTATQNAEIQQQMHDGRDALLELNSCRKNIAEQWIADIEDAELPELLQDYLQTAFDILDIETEEHSYGAIIARPGEEMAISLPGLKEDGSTFCFDRGLALSREDMEFVSWEHPLVLELFDTLMTSETGNACISLLPLNGLPEGTLLVELWFEIQSQSAVSLQIERYLQASPVRLLMDINGKDLSHLVSYLQLNKLGETIGHKKHTAIVSQIRAQVESIYRHGQTLAEQALRDTVEEARQRAQQLIQAESERLISLSKVNPAIRQSEIDYWQDHLTTVMDALNHAEVSCQGMRVLISTHKK